MTYKNNYQENQILKMFVHCWTWRAVSIVFSFNLIILDTEEVNKALDEIHDEIDKVMVTKTELNDALQE